MPAGRRAQRNPANSTARSSGPQHQRTRQADRQPENLTRRKYPTYYWSVPVRTKDSPADLLFGALANPTRRDILTLLLEGPRTAGEIAERYDMARPSVSEHLRVLLDRNLVSEERRGRTIRYLLTPEPLADVASWLSPFEKFWRARLKDLNHTPENMKDT